MSFIFNIRKNTSIKVRLWGLIVIIVVLISILSYFSITGITLVNETGTAINEHYLTSNSDLFTLTENLYSIVIEGKNHILSISPEAKIQAENLINNYILQVEYGLDKYSQNITDKNSIDLFNDFLDEYEVYKRINKEILTLSADNKDYLALELSATSELNSFRNLQKLIQKMMAANLEKATESIQTSESLKENTIIRIYIIISIIIVIAFIIGFIVIQDITTAIRKLKNCLYALHNGHLPKKKLEEFGDELGQMSVLTNTIADNLVYHCNFVQQISNRNYQSEFSPISSNDMLGDQLLILRDNLKVARLDEEKRTVEDTQRNWLSRGLGMFSEILRQNSDQMLKLGDAIISNLIKYIDAIQGGIFTYVDDDKDNIYLDLLASYAYDRRKFLERKIRLGDGLVGTCAVENSTIYIEQLPPDYLEINSGLGSTQPQSLLIVPLKIEETILGVIEVASLNKFEKFQIEFVERLAESIAVSLSSARINERTVKLFQESQRQSKELAAQEAKMLHTISEMKETQEAASEREIEMRGILTAVDNTLIKCEYDLSGILISANPKYLQLMEYRLDEIKGKNVRMFVPEEKNDKFLQYWQNLCNGIPYQGIISRKNRVLETRWLLMSYTPVKDRFGKVFKYFFWQTISPSMLKTKSEPKL
jgi:PAS domain S-box-containing protein